MTRCASVRLALDELRDSPPDTQRAASRITAAVAALEDAANDGLLDATVARSLLLRLTGVSWLLARQAIEDAVARGADEAITALANRIVLGGDALVDAGRYRDAASLYWGAIGLALRG